MYSWSWKALSSEASDGRFFTGYKMEIREPRTPQRSLNSTSMVEHIGYGGLTDNVEAGIEVPVDVLSNNEGADGLVQSATCRRRVD